MLSKPLTLRYRVPGTPDKYNQPSFTVSESEGHGYYQLKSTDDMDAISREQVDYKVYLPASTDTSDLLSVVIDGVEYQVEGPAHLQYNPRVGADAYWQLSVRRAA